MNREDFLSALSERITALPNDEKNKLYEYYNEIILDKKEAGMEEARIIEEFGDIDEIAAKILSEYLPEPEAARPAAEQGAPIPPPYIPSPPQKRSAGKTTLLIITLVFSSPIWLSLILAAFAILLSVAVAIASVVISLWTAALALALSGLAAAVWSVPTMLRNLPLGLISLGAGLLSMGLGCLLTVGMVHLTRRTLRLFGWSSRKLAGLFQRNKRPVEL